MGSGPGEPQIDLCSALGVSDILRVFLAPELECLLCEHEGTWGHIELLQAPVPHVDGIPWV